MPKFSYVAINSKGKKVKGILDAENKKEAKSKIKGEGLLPIELRQAKRMEIRAHFEKREISGRDYSKFCNHFATMVEAGVGTVKALDLISNQTENPFLKEKILEIKGLTEKGDSLSAAMSHNSDIFTPVMISVVKRAEKEGDFPGAFFNLSKYFEKTWKISELMKKKIAYPLELMLVAGMAIFFLIMIVAFSVFANLNEAVLNVSESTKKVLHFLDTFFQSFWFLIPLLAVFYFVLRKYQKSHRFKLFQDRTKMELPFLGKLYRYCIYAQFARTLATLAAADVPIAETIGIAAWTLENETFAKALKDVEVKVLDGAFLSFALEESGLFPPFVYQMIKLGEETGKNEEIFLKIANYYEEETEIEAKKATKTVALLSIAMVGILLLIAVLTAVLPMVRAFN